MGVGISSVLVCGYNIYQSEGEAETARVKASLASLEPPSTVEVDQDESGGLTPTPPCNTPVAGPPSISEEDVMKVLQRVSLSFSPSTEEILDLAEAIDQETEDEDSKEKEDRLDIQRLLFQSPHFMRSRQRIQEDDTVSTLDEASANGRNIIASPTTAHGTPSHHLMLCSPYSDMTSVKSEMFPATERLIGTLRPSLYRDMSGKDSSSELGPSLGVGSSNSTGQLDTVKSVETTNEISDGSVVNRDDATVQRDTINSSRSSSFVSSMTGISSQEHTDGSTSGSDLKVKPGKKYTFRRSVGKAASYILRAGKKKERGGSSSANSSHPLEPVVETPAVKKHAIVKIGRHHA